MVKKILGIILLVIVIIAVGFGLRYREELKLLKYVGADVTQIQEQEEKLREEQNALRETYDIPEITLSQEDLAAIANGEKTIEEVAQAALTANASGEASPDTQVQTGSEAGSQNTGQSAAAQTDPNRAQIQSLLAQVYALQANMNGQVDGIISNMRSQYAALESSQRTAKAKAKIVQDNVASFTALEKSCDAQMSGIIGSLKTLDPDLAAQIQQQYDTAKATKKAAIIAEYS